MWGPDINYSNLIILITFITFPSKAESEDVIHLEKMNVLKDEVTLSGFSAGSSMATQFHIAHSSNFAGVALFSQAFYRCGPGSLIEFGLRCSKLGGGLIPYPVSSGVRDAQNYEARGMIDPLTSLRHQKVFIWTGSLDEYVPEKMAVQNYDFYKTFIETSQIHLRIERAKHLFPTTNFGNGCDQNAEHNFYLGNCNYSGALQSLRFLLGEGIRIPTGSNQEDLSGQLRIYDQSEFYPDGPIRKVGMGDRGYIYIPKDCEGGQVPCYLHFNFHGCNEWPLDIAKKYILNSQFLPVAELNNIIVVFPLTTSIPSNMNGCWDFFSYTGKSFATKQGQQIQVGYRILQRLIHGT